MTGVETFSMTVELMLFDVEAFKKIESQIHMQLTDCERLLRWAIVKIDKLPHNKYICHIEGAYLTRSTVMAGAV